MGGEFEFFELKKSKNEYISASLFDSVKDKAPNFDIDSYNSSVLKSEREKYKDYFDHILDDVNPNIKLDDEQIDAILADEDRALIIAGAGTGKTTTMTAKVKYLVDIKNINPRDILVMSYSNRDVRELRDRINEDLNIPADVTTFHSLGMKYVRQVFAGKKCYVVEDNLRNKIFTEYIENEIYSSPDKLANFMRLFNEETTGDEHIYGPFLKSNYQSFANFNEYFEAYKEHRKNEVKDIRKIIDSRISFDINRSDPRTLKGEKVKSKGEARIANWLFEHCIEYTYEELYDEVLPDANTYRPDFTLRIGGNKYYVEYFGLSNSENPTDKDYERIRKIKEKFHKENKTNFIALDYSKETDYLTVLEKELNKYGIATDKIRSDSEVYETILDRNKLAEFYRLESFFYRIVDKIKASDTREDFDALVNEVIEKNSDIDSASLMRAQYRQIRKFYIYYGKKIHREEDRIGFDFSDMIYYARKYVNTLDETSFNYKYVIVDEYQDISSDRYALANATVSRSGAKLLAVGDDWQTIYSFAGSRIEYVYNFQKYFKGAKLFRITKTYRNSQSLIDYAGKFIMRNPSQIKKDLRSDKQLNDPFVFIDFSGDKNDDALHEEFAALRHSIIQIHRQRPNDSILILSRTNSVIRHLFDYGDGYYRKELGTKVSLTDFPDFQFDAMSIHKSKGLTADWTFLIGLNAGFPGDDRPTFWIEDIFQQKPIDEGISNAEERRVFYVALTRSRYKVILFRDTNMKRRSSFVDELYNIMRADQEDRYK
ncbi:MAG: UvrD-helicase domain-containing protein [Candidatus Saccharibacteria bacterium]|nr:UvrD-helicase domain-containing protein [Candidatus Saccharibacteria bacterium]